MNGNPISYGDRVRVLAGKYAGMIGTVIDPACAGEMLPKPREAYFWVSVILGKFVVPAHLHQDDVQLIGARDDSYDRSFVYWV